MEQSHEPSTCEGWQRWLDAIKETLPKLPKKGKQHVYSHETPPYMFIFQVKISMTNICSGANCIL